MGLPWSDPNFAVRNPLASAVLGARRPARATSATDARRARPAAAHDDAGGPDRWVTSSFSRKRVVLSLGLDTYQTWPPRLNSKFSDGAFSGVSRSVRSRWGAPTRRATT